MPGSLYGINYVQNSCVWEGQHCKTGYIRKYVCIFSPYNCYTNITLWMLQLNEFSRKTSFLFIIAWIGTILLPSWGWHWTWKDSVSQFLACVLPHQRGGCGKLPNDDVTVYRTVLLGPYALRITSHIIFTVLIK